ncbi:hypothetical protein ASZ90_017172 [hydrocarbon metagenome]|uniref:Uncharacterized protein n=1 Tax=hydrocarbon metagenome TaxID=938273 RepID=A0A0W8EA15_9ZZZZ
MSIEKIILITAWIITIIMLLLLVPKDRIREAQVIFFFKQIITWIFGLAVVELRLIEYPVRFFSYAARTSFTFEYFVYPAICIFFVLRYPQEKSCLRQFMYYFYFCTGITALELLLEIYTDTIKYVNWTWYLTWITLFITFYISRKYYVWFFRIEG